MNFGFSGEMIFLFFLALILFGPRRLPEIGRQIGRIMNEFRRASNEFRSQIEAEINIEEAKKMPQILPPLKQPLGALASRIFNPPAAEQPRAEETRVAETKPAPATASENADVRKGLTSSESSAEGVASQVTPSSAVSPSVALPPVTSSKAAPDA